MPIDRSRRALLEAASRSDVALAFENSSEGIATVARRGASTWKVIRLGPDRALVRVLGDELGSGAIYEVARILDAFRRSSRRST